MRHNKVICVGRNYVEHAKELNNPVPTEPILFLKPSTAVSAFEEPIAVSQSPHAIHYELEVAILIGQELKQANTQQASAAIDGIGLALDLTKRELQQELAKQGKPWEIAKAFDTSCPVSTFIDNNKLDLGQLDFELLIDGEVKQQANTSMMITPILELLCYASQHFTLLPGDLVLTGTPKGVGQLLPGMHIEAKLGDLLAVKGKAI